jgi:hypothetical protein
MKETVKRLPTCFLSHGDGPWPWRAGPFREHYRPLEASLKDVANELGGVYHEEDFFGGGTASSFRFG